MQNYAKEFINMVTKNAMPYSFGTPRNVQAVIDSTNLTIDVSWDAVTYADYYMVYRNNSNSSYSNYTLIADSVASTSWKDERPMSGNNYYKVCAVGLGLTSEKSNGSNSVSCSLDAPKNISGELVLNGDSLAIRMKWDAVKYAEYYKIYRSNNYRNGYELMEDSVTNISWMDASPLAGSNYYKICAVSRSITSSESNYCEVKCALDVPKNVKATLGDVNLVVNVTWDKVNVAQWYMVYRSNSSNSGYKLLVDSVASTTWRDDAPMKGNNYYKVSAAGYGLTSSQSNASNVVNCSLDAPKNIKATFDDSTFSISVTWDEVKYAKHYKIYRSNSSNSDYGLLADSVASTSWKDFAPMKGKNYYKVYAVCNEIISAASNYATANCPLELDAPKNLVGEMILNDGKLVINVKWDSTKNAEYYKVYRSSNNNSGFTLIADAIMYSSFIDESPLSGINYYRVRAFGHGLSSPDSNTSEGISFSLPAPEHVTGNLIQDGDSPIINIAWDSVKYAKSYNVYRCNLSYGEFVLLAEGISSTFWRDEVPLKGRNYYKVSASGYGLTSPLSAAVKIANYANMGQIAINTIISDGDMQPIFVGGYINNYNEDYVTKKGVIVSKQIGDLIINENSKFEKIGEDRTPKDLRVIDCTGINEEEFMCGLLDLEGNTDYYVRAFAITDEGEVLYGDEEIVHSQTFSRYKGRADYANVYYYNSYTLFDLVTDEIISPEQGYYGSTNENPKRVAYKPSYACYKFASEWNYKLWYYHSGHCDNNKKVSIPVMRMNDGKLEITKAEADKDKTVSIFYCVDGDGRHPENFSEKYTSPINVAKGSAVYCYAISSDGYISYTNRYIVF
jgi:fibronectin type 3 domain-containing protein